MLPIEVTLLTIFFIQLHAVCVTFEILFMKILDSFQHLRYLWKLALTELFQKHSISLLDKNEALDPTGS